MKWHSPVNLFVDKDTNVEIVISTTCTYSFFQLQQENVFVLHSFSILIILFDVIRRFSWFYFGKLLKHGNENLSQHMVHNEVSWVFIFMLLKR